MDTKAGNFLNTTLIGRLGNGDNILGLRAGITILLISAALTKDRLSYVVLDKSVFSYITKLLLLNSFIFEGIVCALSITYYMYSLLSLSQTILFSI